MLHELRRAGALALQRAQLVGVRFVLLLRTRILPDVVLWVPDVLH